MWDVSREEGEERSQDDVVLDYLMGEEELHCDCVSFVVLRFIAILFDF
jgi:hypothetical protein